MDGMSGGGAPKVLMYATRHSVHRSEEHTSELQSQSKLVCRLLLEKKKLEAASSGLLVRAHRSQRALICTCPSIRTRKPCRILCRRSSGPSALRRPPATSSFSPHPR